MERFINGMRQGAYLLKRKKEIHIELNIQINSFQNSNQAPAMKLE
jgi:hypothetical protein